MLRFILVGLGLFLLLTHAHAQAPKKQSAYDSLYAKAYHAGNHQPNSAIHYAQQAIKLTQDSTKQAQAHKLIAFYSSRLGYYAMAVQHYQKAYDLYIKPAQKATMLDNIALCYQNIGNYEQALTLMKKAVKRYEKLQDSVKLCRILHILANCYRSQQEYKSAQQAFSRAIHIAQANNKTRLVSIYSDLARLKEQQTQYDSAVYYQRFALEQFAETNAIKKCTRLARLSWYYILAEKPRLARQCMGKAQSIKQNGIESTAILHAINGFLLFVEHKEAQAKQAIGRSDSLLKHLREQSTSPVQQKFARKLAYEINQSGYKLLRHVWFYSENKARFAPLKQWFADRLAYEKERYGEIKIRVALKDSLQIERAKPKNQTNIIHQISLWQWIVLAATIAIGIGWVYNRRTKKLQAHNEKAKAHKGKLQAYKDKAEAEAKKLQAYKDKTEAEVKKLQAYKDKTEAEVKKLQAYKDKAEAEAKKLQAYKDKAEAEAKKLQAETELAAAHKEFVQAIRFSLLRGFEDVSDAEIEILIKVEKLLGKRPDTINMKILLLISRGHTYVEAAVKLKLNEGAVKTRVQRLKEACGLNNIRDIM